MNTDPFEFIKSKLLPKKSDDSQNKLTYKKIKSSFFQFGTLFYSYKLMERSILQNMVIDGLLTPPSYCRLNAFAATLKFLPGTVGSGANLGIQVIHSLLGGLGQIKIGNLFSSAPAQQIMSALMPSLNTNENRALATLEHKYWIEEFRCQISTFKTKPSLKVLANIFGGFLGSAAYVPFRMTFQYGGSRTRSMSKGLLNPRFVAVMTGIVGVYGFIMALTQWTDLNGVDKSINPPDSDKYDL